MSQITYMIQRTITDWTGPHWPLFLAIAFTFFCIGRALPKEARKVFRIATTILAIAAYIVWYCSIPGDPNSGEAVEKVATAPKPLLENNATLTELRGSLARRREYDLWLLANLHRTMNAQSPQEKFLRYCTILVKGGEQFLDSAPETTYALRADGIIDVWGRPTTPEQQFREGQRAQYELENGDPLVNDCAGSLYWFRTWHDQPMSSDTELMESAAKARADLNKIDKTLDPRLVEDLPQPRSEEASPAPPALPPSGTPQSDGTSTNISDLTRTAGPTSGEQQSGGASTGVTSQPILLSKVEPGYSDEATKANFSGKVEASIVIDERGNVGNVTIIDSPGLGLDEKVAAALRQWRFKPAMKNGVPVSFQMMVTETFTRQ